jgi:autoinducer 2-degrading protein
LPENCPKNGDVPKSPFKNRQPLPSVGKHLKSSSVQRGCPSVPRDFDKPAQGEIAMLKSIVTPIAAIALSVAAWLLLPMRSHEVAAQSGPFFILVVEMDVVPAELDKYMVAIKENAIGCVKEPGCREFNVTVSENDPNHLLLFEVFSNAAAWNEHRATDVFKKFQADTANMTDHRVIKKFSSVAINIKGM